ncbi:MAG: hypothetical protein Q8W44_12020 [Candidatus Palauibacterales bacterium]|nr:hypothetical protein [Candidatus Palauibacterales bacterium]
MRAGARGATVLVAAATLAAVACGGGGGGQLTASPSEYGAPTAEQAVRSFLDAAGQEEYPVMGRVFGTRQGPAEARLGVTNVEQRMIVLSGLLQHDSYTLRPSTLTEPEPHSRRFNATITGTRQGEVTVPIFAVRSENGRWFVERLDTAPLTTGSP